MSTIELEKSLGGPFLFTHLYEVLRRHAQELSERMRHCYEAIDGDSSTLLPCLGEIRDCQDALIDRFFLLMGLCNGVKIEKEQAVPKTFFLTAVPLHVRLQILGMTGDIHRSVWKVEHQLFA